MFDLSIKVDIVKSSIQSIYSFVTLNRRNILIRTVVSNPFNLFLYAFFPYKTNK